MKQQFKLSVRQKLLASFILYLIVQTYSIAAMPLACTQPGCVEECNYRFVVEAGVGLLNPTIEVKTIFERGSADESSIRILIRSPQLGNWDGESFYDAQTFAIRRYQFVHLEGQDRKNRAMPNHRVSVVEFDQNTGAAQVQSSIIDPRGVRDLNLTQTFNQMFVNPAATNARWTGQVEAALARTSAVKTENVTIPVSNLEESTVVDSGALNFYLLRYTVENLPALAQYQMLGQPTPDTILGTNIDGSLLRRIGGAFRTHQSGDLIHVSGQTRLGGFHARLEADVHTGQNRFSNLNFFFPVVNERGQPVNANKDVVTDPSQQQVLQIRSTNRNMANQCVVRR